METLPENGFAKKVFGNDHPVLEAVHHYLRELPADKLLIEDERAGTLRTVACFN